MTLCVICNKKMTTDEYLAATQSDMYCPSKDIDFDKMCDMCDAKSRARSCAHSIFGEMTKAKKEVQGGGIYSTEAFLNKQLDSLRKYWKRWYTEFLNENDKIKYSNWLTIFNQEVVKLTKDATIMERIDIKKNTDY